MLYEVITVGLAGRRLHAEERGHLHARAIHEAPLPQRREVADALRVAQQMQLGRVPGNLDVRLADVAPVHVGETEPVV